MLWWIQADQGGQAARQQGGLLSPLTVGPAPLNAARAWMACMRLRSDCTVTSGSTARIALRGTLMNSSA